MATYTLKAPNGKTYTIEGPQGQTEDQVRAEIVKRDPTAAGGDRAGLVEYQDENGNWVSANQPAAPPQPEKPASFTQGVVEGFEKPWNNAADFVTNGLNLIRGGPSGNEGLGDSLNRTLSEWGSDIGLNMAPSVQAARDNQQQARDQSPYSSSPVGEFAGEVGGAALFSRLPGGVLSKGAQAGALLTDNPNDPMGVAEDATIGAVTGKVGDTLIRGAARVAAPTVSSGLRTLLDAGVRVTPGQVGRSIPGRLGTAIARTEDRATSAPFVGDTITDARNNSLDDFARATINRAVNPIGESLPDSVPTGRGAVKWAGDKLSNAYNAIAPRIRVDGSDPQFIGDLTSIQGETGTMLPARAKQFTSILKGLDRFWRDQGTVLSGDAFKAVDERLGQNIRRYATSTDADAQHLGMMLESVRDAMYDAASRQNPQVAGELKALNQGWKSLTQVERASGNSKAAVSPNGYSQAVKLSSDTVRRRGYARGEALNQDLSDAGSAILPSDIADSGSAGRLNQQSILPNLIGLAQIPGYKAAQKITPLLLRQSAVSPRLAELLRYGALGSPYAAPALVDNTP